MSNPLLDSVRRIHSGGHVMTVWVRTAPELRALAQALSVVPAFALDTESDSLHHHREKVCLLQIAVGPEQAWLVDPLALRDLSPLAPVMADAGVTKVLHGADYDVTSLKRDFAFVITGLFDTMIAARFLGLPQVGLQAVLESELGVSVGKESRLDDWSRRPLTRKQEAYALDDVRHLLAVFERFRDRLRTLGRLPWVEEECATVSALAPARRQRDPEAYRRIKGAARLTPRQLAVLRAFVDWREDVATATDIPAFKIASTETLLRLAVAPPQNGDELKRTPGAWSRWPERTPALMQAVAKALALPEAELPRIKPALRPSVSEATKKRIQALRLWRADKAKALGVDVAVVLPGRLLEKAAEQAPADVGDLAAIDGFRRWRLEAFGRDIVAHLQTV